MQAASSLLSAITDAPTDEERWGAMLIYSDFLDDEGRHDEAEFVRWLRAHEKWPAPWYFIESWWQWTYGEFKGEEHRGLPFVMCQAAGLSIVPAHETLIEALVFAAENFIQARRAGWQPEWPETSSTGDSGNLGDSEHQPRFS